MHVSVLPPCIYLLHTCLMPMDSLELELKMVVGHWEDACIVLDPLGEQ